MLLDEPTSALDPARERIRTNLEFGLRYHVDAIQEMQ